MPVNEKIIHLAKIIFQKEGKNMYDYQENLLNEFQKNKFVIINKARQTGVSDLLALYGLIQALIFSKKVLIISPSLRQSKHLMDYIYSHLHVFEEKFLIKKREETKTSIIFDKGEIYSLPCNSQTIRGFEAGVIIFDEFAHFPYGLDEEIWQAALPMASRGGQVIICSTPFGKDNLFYHFWQQNNMKKVEINYKQCPHLDVEKIRMNIDELTFAQEYNNYFIEDSIEREFNDSLIMQCINHELAKGEISENKKYVGIDIGRKHDLTAVAIFSIKEDKFVFEDYFIMKNVEFDEQEKRIVDILENYPCLNINVDATGVGAMLAERLAKKLMNVKQINITNEIKEKMILNLKLLMQKKEVEFFDDAFLISSFRAIRRKYTENNILKFEVVGDEEIGHADLFFAIALALFIPRKSSTPRVVKTRW
ncbi:MAG: terminase family protein [Candidatus Thermoplasmatota archaeon]